METWFVVIVSLCTAALTRSILFRRSHRKKLPPGPSLLHSSYLLLTNSFLRFEPILINLKAKYGPFFTLATGIGPSIFVGSHSLAHQILIRKGALFADRPKTLVMRNISTASYGPTWRLLRRNLATEIMHPSRIRSYSSGRKWVLHILINRLSEQHDEAAGVKVVDHFHYAVFCLLVLMCFGEKFDETRINEIAKVQRDMLMVMSSGRFAVLRMFPRLGKILFRNRWKEFEKLRDNKEKVLIPIIKSRIEETNSKPQLVAYVDTFENLRLPEEEEEEKEANNGKLTYKEMVSMCSEFLNGGTDTTVTALQWIMANLVKHPHIQRKLYEEIVAVVGVGPPVPQPDKEVGLKSVLNEEELQKMPYLKAVVLEGLRRHPPGHFVLPHKVMKEVEVQGYVIPQGAIINFMVGEMGLDSKVWDEPLEFKPERFMMNDGVFDINGSKEIKMMPFGAGRRICPGSDLALLHLEYFVANLIWYFDWSAPDGYEVDLSEKVEFTVVMKNPLRAQIIPRTEK